MNIKDANNDGIAMDGFDPVAYANGEPLRGTAEYQFMLRDMTYYFANKENRLAFEKDPAKYEPIIGSYVSESFRGNINAADPSNKPTGNKTFISRKNLADTPVSIENEVSIDIKEDGTVVQQNLSDADN